jgi:E3 ubiquitin-protein ligase MYCBP2
MIKLKTVEIESRSTGWMNCSILNPRHVVVGLQLKGPDNSLRVRQIRVLGEIEGASLKIGKHVNALSIQQKNCESETLKVFRSISSQVKFCLENSIKKYFHLIYFNYIIYFMNM